MIPAFNCSDDSSDNDTENDVGLSLKLAGNIGTLQDKIETAAVFSQETLDVKTNTGKDLNSFWDTEGVDSLFDGTTGISARDWMEQITNPEFVSNTLNPKTPFGRFITVMSIGCAIDTLIDLDSNGLIMAGEHDVSVTTDLMVDCGESDS